MTEDEINIGSKVMEFDIKNITCRSIRLKICLMKVLIVTLVVLYLASSASAMPGIDEANGASASSSAPSIEFTYLPPYGTTENLKGRVTNANPNDYKVAVYIFVSGWYNKPTFANRLTPIRNDGTWTCDITVPNTNDPFATKIKAYLVSNDDITDYFPPKVNGNKTLPLIL